MTDLDFENINTDSEQYEQFIEIVRHYFAIDGRTATLLSDLMAYAVWHTTLKALGIQYRVDFQDDSPIHDAAKHFSEHIAEIFLRAYKDRGSQL